MAVKIDCTNLNSKKRTDLSGIRRVARKALKLMGACDIELNVVLVSNQRIRAMNRKYLKRDNATDVIAFDQSLKPAGERKRLVLGDVFISTDMAERNAKEYGTSTKEETELYVIHGILHVLGYRDGTKKEKETMKRKEHELKKKIHRHT